MKKLLIAIVAFLPLVCAAQDVKTLTPEQQLEQAQKQLEAAQKAVEAARANAQKASKAAAEAEKQRKAKELAEKQAAIQAQIKKAQEEAARLNAEAEKLNAEAQKVSGGTVVAPAEQPQTPIVTSGQTKTLKNKAKKDKTKQEIQVQYNDVNGWSAVTPPAPAAKQNVKKEKQNVENEYEGYLAGAVPLVDGKVVFEEKFSYPGKTAEELYDKAFEYVNNLTVDENQKTDSQLRSRISIINKNTHSIAAKMYEWLVFTNNMLMIDRTDFTYTLIVNCMDESIDVKMERMSYTYEANRSTGFTESAHNVIADKYALNKKQNKVVRPYGKFRIKTINRKNAIFAGFSHLFE